MIRFRITALATVLAGVLLVAASIALVALQRQQLMTGVDNSLTQLADTYEANFASAAGSEAAASALALTLDDDRAVQLVAANGTVLAATANLVGHPPLGTGVVRETIVTQQLLPIEDDSYRLLSRPVVSETGDASVLHVAENIDDLNDALRGLAIALAISVPTVLALQAGLTWWLVGRTLRPVEHIRAQVGHISGSALDQRVPVPEQDDEIARLATTMNQMLDRLDTSSRRQRQFVADASHELRTPLTRIRTEVEVDLSQPATADSLVTARTVLEEAISLQALLDDLLFLARSDESLSTPPYEPVDLDTIIRHEAAAQRSETTVAIDTSRVGHALLMAEPTQLTRVIRNLLSNACRHASTTIEVSLAEHEGEVHLLVDDDGPGVPTAIREHIFERFSRVDDARVRELGGTGLGLAIVRDIVSRHGGTVVCQEGRLGGAQFMAVFPTGADFPNE